MEAFADGVWIQEEASLRFYGVPLQTRMAVLELDAGLLLYSPVFFTPELGREIDALGRVAFVVSPNKIHNQTLAAWREAYPDARHLAPPGLPERRPELRFDAVVEDGAETGFQGEVDCVVTRGNAFFSEILLHHRRSRTLLVGDLVENLGPGTLTPLAWLLARSFGVPARPAASPEFRLFTHDAGRAAESLAPARAWDFERIFLCHGRLIGEEAQATFGAVCDELLGTAARRGRISRRVTAFMARRQ